MSDEEYDVGYGKPPKEHRFKPGSSGNPKGRPRGAKNMTTLAREIGSEKVTVTEGGKRRRVPKSVAMVMALFQKAMKGDVRAIKLLREIYGVNEREQDQANPSGALDRVDQEIIERFLQKARPGETAEGAS